MSENPASTIGFERRFNALLGIEDEDAFVAELTGSLQPQPPNFHRIVELNRGPLIRHAGLVEPLAAARVEELLADGALLLDGRDPREFDAAHLPGSLNTTMVKAAVGTRAAWVADPEAPVVVNAAGEREAREIARMLEAVGFRRVLGTLAGGIAAWRDSGRPTATTPALDVPGLAERLRDDAVVLVDVREEDEWRGGHVPGSVFVPYHQLRDGVPDSVREAARRGPLAVACSAGNRSSLAASLLRRHGIDDLIHVADGGVAELAGHGVPLEEAA